MAARKPINRTYDSSKDTNQEVVLDLAPSHSEGYRSRPSQVLLVWWGLRISPTVQEASKLFLVRDDSRGRFVFCPRPNPSHPSSGSADARLSSPSRHHPIRRSDVEMQICGETECQCRLRSSCLMQGLS